MNLSDGSGVGNAYERAEGDEASRGGRSGRKNRGKARVAPEEFFRAPQEGLRSNFKSLLLRQDKKSVLERGRIFGLCDELYC